MAAKDEIERELKYFFGASIFLSASTEADNGESETIGTLSIAWVHANGQSTSHILFFPLLIKSRAQESPFRHHVQLGNVSESGWNG